MLKTTLTIAGLTLASIIHLSAANAASINSYRNPSNNLGSSAHHGGAVYVPATGWDGDNPFPNHNQGGEPAHNGGSGTTKPGSYNPSGAICCSSSSGGGQYSPPPAPQLSICCGQPGQPPLYPRLPPKIRGPFPGPIPLGDPRTE